MNNERSIALQEQRLPSPSNSNGLPAAVTRDITVSLHEIHRERIVTTFGQIFSGIQVSQDFIKSIDKSATYIARIPKHLKKAFDAGDLQFMVKGDTGEQLGALVGADRMNRGFVRIEEAIPAPTELAGSLASLAMQQQLAQIAEIIDEVRSRVTELKTIHDHDLLGALRGMHTQLTQIKYITVESRRIHLTLSAITVLNKTLGQIEQRLLDELEKLPNVPKNKLLAEIKVFWSTGYYSKIEQGYESIQELFDFYLSGLQMLAYAYGFLGEKNVAANIFVPSEELCNNPNLLKMTRAESICADEICDTAWYKTPDEYLQHISQRINSLYEEGRDYLHIEINGEELMEVLSDVERNEE